MKRLQKRPEKKHISFGNDRKKSKSNDKGKNNSKKLKQVLRFAQDDNSVEMREWDRK